MPLSIGTTLGPYVIGDAIGAGGMGEVYKATDPRLGRTVAIKVLADPVATDPQLKQRFDREAKAISSLNHPNVCVLYDVGRDHGVDFLVMEYLEGEPLSERLRKGPLALTRALHHAVEIADALDKAHHLGIVHRDLKPGNIMLTKGGAKLLDFGLAKLGPHPSTNQAITAPPTVSSPLTGHGSVLGTFQYMAPEQIEGREADARSDIFAFGATLYEMLTGRRAFEGKSQATVIGAIMSADPPPLSQVLPAAPPALERLVRKCLEKDPDRRWESARDLADELRWVADPGTTSALAAGAPSRSPRVAWGLALLVIGALLGGLAAWVLRPANEAEPSAPIRLAINAPAADTLAFDSNGRTFALSPDGQTLVFAATRNGVTQLYRRRLGDLSAEPITGTSGAGRPFFSPDSRSIGFFTADGAMRIPVEGGTPISIREWRTLGGQATWDADGNILWGEYGVGSSLEQMPVSGGTSRQITLRKQEELDHGWPEVLPGRQAMIFSIDYSANLPSKIVVQPLPAGEPRFLIEGFAPRYSRTGHLVFMRGNAIWAAGFDAERMAIRGEAVPIMQDVRTGQFSVSDSGTLAYAPQPADASRVLVWVDRSGREEAIDIPPRLYVHPEFSPDERKVVLAGDGPDSDIWIYDFESKATTQLTFNPGQDLYPLWSRDGSRIAFSSSQGGVRNLYWQPADGSGAAERLTTSPNTQSPWSWSRDGRSLLLHHQKSPPNQDWDIYTLSMEQRQAQPLIHADVSELDPAVSPNGKWLAHTVGNDVWVRPYPSVDAGRWRISAQGGREPKWSADGTRLYFWTLSPAVLFEVDIAETPGFTAGTPRRVLGLQPYVMRPGGRNYDVARSGRFLFIKESGGADRTTTPATFVVIVNWAEELKQLLPLK